uniref:Reverse transcriptase domain-containing protein n=1 Tax=Xiphophorus maculatus TaxID=8083 RepID=A0A3B5PV23_XIPMA
MMHSNFLIFLIFLNCFWHVVFSLLPIMDSFKIASLNLNGAREAKKRALVYQMLNQKRIDVIFLQETHSDLLIEADWRREWRGEVILSHGTSKNAGVGFVFSKAFIPLSIETEHVIQGRCLLVKMKFDFFNMVFINIYAPIVNAEKKCFYEKIGERLENCETEDYVFIGGDFNCTENEFLDRNHAEPHPAAQHVLKQLVSSHSLVDVWRRMHAGFRQYTWSHIKEGKISLARLDRFYCFKHHFNVFKTCQIVPVPFTDHSLLLGSVFIRNILPRSAYWHFNSALIYDQSFKEVLTYFWTGFRETKADFSSIKQWWDYGKVQIRLLSQQHTVNVTRDITESIRDLEMSIVDLERLSDTTGNREYFEALKSKRLTLANLLESKVQGALVRSRMQNITEMDAPSGFFFGLERKQGQRKMIHSLLSDTGQHLSEPGQIRRRAVEFYHSLFRSEYDESERMMEEFCEELPQIYKETSTDLERPLGIQELHTALQSMQGQKSPGVDGLTVEFFKAYWDLLAQDMLEMYNESLATGSLPTSCRRAVITLLPKKGDLQEIKNWRPVSLLCTDYKILSKALATRLGKAMEQVIHRDQTYCVPGRSMVDNVYLIRDILEVSSSLGLQTGLISLDQEKAFDRVEHDFLWKVMRRFGFGEGFIAKIQVMYSDIESVLKINGSLCAPFRVCRGVRQGCALSGMLYALSLEPLLLKIRSEIHGLVLPGFNNKLILSAYADDVVVFIKDQHDVNILIEIIEKFSVLSAAKVNWGKTVALAVGEWPGGLPVLPQRLQWKRDGFKYLGVFLGGKDTVKRNWEDLEQKIQNKLAKWKWLHKQMSYRGRVLVLNNLVASQLWHKLAVLDPPSGLLVKIQSEMVNFFWNNHHWVPQSVLFLSREEGGQGLVHLASRAAVFRLQFLQKYLTGSPVWRDVASCILRRVNFLGLDAALFLTNFSLLKLKGIPQFYQSVFRSCAFFKLHRPDKNNSLYWLLEEPLICGARLDVSDNAVPGFSEVLSESRTVTLRQLIQASGPDFDNAQEVASVIGIRSVRLTRRFLERVKNRLTAEERRLLQWYEKEECLPDSTDPFPEMFLDPDFEEDSGPLLQSTDSKMDLCKTGPKILYRYCTKLLNKRTLQKREVSVWDSKFGGQKTHWRTLYKPPIKKRTGDLQWRILHGAIATNSFLSVISPGVLNECPFCKMSESVFHVFIDCARLTSFFNLLSTFFSFFHMVFSNAVFINGVHHSKTTSFKSRILNYLISEAKMAIYITRRDRMQAGPQFDAVTLWKVNVKARLRLEFCFHRATGNLSGFLSLWGFKNVLCTISDQKDLFYNKLLL